MEQEIMVSVLCTAYNHEKYIRQCLDGFVMQKTNFKYEVIVHDDASTDKTADIIREYEKKYPDIIKPIYQTENQYSKGVYLGRIMYPKCNGKYIASCEGDDFWIDEFKLQKQVDVLENNLNCKLCVCTVRDANEDGTFRDTTHPSEIIESGIISTEDFFKLASREYPFQTSSYLREKESFMKYIDTSPEYRKGCPVGDWPQLLYFSQIGDIYYLKDAMSCYRRNVQGSVTTTVFIKDVNKKKKYYAGMVRMMEKFDECSEYKFHKYCQQFIDRFQKYYYDCLKEERNFKELVKKEYETFFKQERFKDRVFIKSSVYFPFLAKMYSKIRK